MSLHGNICFLGEHQSSEKPVQQNWLLNLQCKVHLFPKRNIFKIFFYFRAQDWKEALHWYNAALNMTDYDEGGEYDGTQDEPRYLLLAREAEMLMMGGFNLDKDPQRSGEASFCFCCL